MTEQQKELVTNHHNLIYFVINNMHLPEDEYYDIVAIALCEAAIKYDDSKGKFSTFAVNMCQNVVKNHIKSMYGTKKRGVSVLLPTGGEIDNSSVVKGKHASEYDFTSDICAREFLDYFVQHKLTEREQKVLTYVLNSVPYRTIGEKMNISTGTVVNTLKSVQRKYVRCCA